MAASPDGRVRVLAVDPTARGFGYVVLEGQERLLDWGVTFTTRDKNSASLLRITALIRRYDPDVVVIEDHASRACRRRPRARQLLREIARLSSSHMVVIEKVSMRTVRRAFSEIGVVSKYTVAVALASRYEQLAHLLPSRRKPWKSEPERMGIFDAAAFAVAYLELDAPPDQSASVV